MTAGPGSCDAVWRHSSSKDHRRGAGGPDAAGEPSIAIDNFTFAPAEVTVKAGTKVLFVNHHDIPHLVVLENGKVRSGVGYG
jgi:plastocyanin